MTRRWLLLLTLLPACAAPLGEKPPPAQPVQIETNQEFAAIARFEDLRSNPDQVLRGQKHDFPLFKAVIPDITHSLVVEPDGDIIRSSPNRSR